MRRRTGMIAAVLMTLLLVLTARAEDPVVVRVGNFTYPLSLVQGSLDAVIALSESMEGEELSSEDRARLAADTISNFVGIGLVESKLTEAGQHDFTDEEIELMRGAANAQYENLWQGVYQMAVKNGDDVTEEQVVQTLAEGGYTQDEIYRSYEVNERQRRAIALFVPEIPLTEEEVADYYESQYLAPDRERYKDNIPRYEKEILAGDNESFYTPEGYRAIRQILLKYPQEAVDALAVDRTKVEKAAKALSAALTKLAEAAAKAEDWSELDAPRADYDAANDVLLAAQREYRDRRQSVTMPLVQDTIDRIYAGLEAGIDFKTMIPRFSDDTSEQNVTGRGYPLHAESEGWPTEFIEAGMALKAPGDVSRPVLTEKGVHILYYDADIPSGDHVLTREEKDLLNQSALYYYQTLALEELFETWKKDYIIETRPELLTY